MFKSVLYTAFALTLASPIVANASTYAISTTSIDNFTVSGGAVSGWTFSQNIAIDGTNVLANGDSLNAPGSCINCSYDDSFVSHGQTSGYTYSDSIITSTDLNGAGGSAASIAEIYSDSSTSGSAMSSNSMTGILNVASAGTVTFDFDVDYYLEVLTSNQDTGLANFSFDLGLYESGNGVNLLDSYAAASIFVGIGPNDGSATLNTSDNVSIALAAGLYNIDINMTQNVATSITPVPVPAALWLLGSGLLGLIGFVRRKTA